MPDLDLQPVDLVCPCGKPLQLAKLSDGRWVLGDFATMCSPMVYSTDANKVLEEYHKAVTSGTFKAPTVAQS